MSFVVKDGKLIQTEAPQVQKSFVKPLPKALFRVRNGKLVTGFCPDRDKKPISYPLPKSYWRISKYVNKGRLYHEMYRIVNTAGAFQDVATLEKVSIPQSVKKIGEFAFAGTALKKVRIAVDCEYFPTSFPEGCVVEFYGQEV